MSTTDRPELDTPAVRLAAVTAERDRLGAEVARLRARATRQLGILRAAIAAHPAPVETADDEANVGVMVSGVRGQLSPEDSAAIGRIARAACKLVGAPEDTTPVEQPSPQPVAPPCADHEGDAARRLALLNQAYDTIESAKRCGDWGADSIIAERIRNALRAIEAEIAASETDRAGGER